MTFRFPRLVLGCSVALAGCAGGGTPTLSTFSDSASYAIGMSMGQSLGPAVDQVDLDVLVAGLRAEAAGASQLALNDAQQILQAFSQQMQQVAMQTQQAAADSNREASRLFLEENAQREGVTTTASGLQWEVIEEGDGPKPTAEDRVTVHYRGMLPDGTEFETTFGAQPVSFALNGVIPGWTEGLQLMSVGSTYRFAIPSDLAYGPMGSGRSIGPDQALIFEVELISIQ